MTEDFLHYIWKFRKFDQLNIETAEGLPVEIIETGTHNQDSGPDFLDAKLRIDGTLWVGNVEIHISSSSWYKHNHDKDPAYDSVILHVVYSLDQPVYIGKRELPTLVLKDRFDYQVYRLYKSWKKNSQFIRCENEVAKVSSIVKSSAVEEMAVKRISEKAAHSIDILNQTKGDLEECFYRLLSRSMGLKVNAIPFEILAKITPFSLVRKVRSSQLKLDALLLGQSGLLQSTNHEHPYLQATRFEYSYLAKKHKLEPMPSQSWKLMRLRPDNFPAVRIAQISRIYFKNSSLAQKISEIDSVDALISIFQNIAPENDFWKSHYTLEKESPVRTKNLGSSRIRIILINAVVPFLFALASYSKNDVYKTKALNILESLEPEENKITRKFVELGFSSRSALDSQGFIGLKKTYCDEFKCIRCKIGVNILNNHEKSSLSHL
jgi:hypothetical protein